MYLRFGWVLGQVGLFKTLISEMIVMENSKDADMVFLGMRYPAEGESVEQYSLYYQKLLEETEELPATAFVLAAENIQFHWIFR